MSATTESPLTPLQGTGLLVLRNYVTYKSAWKLFLTGFLEPVFYLFSIGIGVGKLIHAFELNGHSIPYAEFVAPGNEMKDPASIASFYKRGAAGKTR